MLGNLFKIINISIKEVKDLYKGKKQIGIDAIYNFVKRKAG